MEFYHLSIWFLVVFRAEGMGEVGREKEEREGSRPIRWQHVTERVGIKSIFKNKIKILGSIRLSHITF